jgi:triphosphatase
MGLTGPEERSEPSPSTPSDRPGAAADPGAATDPGGSEAGAATDPGAATRREAQPAPRPAPRLEGSPVPIDPEDSFGAAGRKAMWLHVQRLLELDAKLRHSDADRDLKRYRVATRRLRAALRAFEDAFPKRDTGRMRDRLAALADTVGAVRDPEVRIADLTQWAVEQEAGARDAVEPLIAAWRADRDAGARHLEVALGERRHDRLLDDLRAFVSDTHDPGVDGSPGGRPIALRAGALLWADYERLLAFDRVIPWADLETLHRIRIEAKRLRYLIEFLGELLGPERQALVRPLVAVQDHLGLLHDLAVNGEAVRAFLLHPGEALSSETRSTVEAYLRERERGVARLRRSVGRPWRGVVGITFGRRLARVALEASRSATPAAGTTAAGTSAPGKRRGAI